ncbi:hypothetical protein [Actinomycetospora straminea]|uniref:Uncharacterized protein n=1 Tax=Actinomycetospora straminea TaxID=663607 RepID=A0ABP9EMW9_9PSEU|nr:hypothetical protein [Actinomycetospora straminea]MDD7933460.1 hypothetical protein [Actinomycetospora straminea]
MSALDELREDVAATVRDVMRRRAPETLQALEATDDPSMSLRQEVEDVLAREFSSKDGLGPDWEPTPYGKQVDEAIGAFVMRFPIERR